MMDREQLQRGERDFIAFKGNKLIYVFSQEGHRGPLELSKWLTESDMNMLDENPEMLHSAEKLFWLLTDDPKLMLHVSE